MTNPDGKPKKFKSLSELGNWIREQDSISDSEARKRANEKTFPVTTNTFSERRALLERGVRLLDPYPKYKRYATYLRLRIMGCKNDFIAGQVGCKIEDLVCLEKQAIYVVQNLLCVSSYAQLASS